MNKAEIRKGAMADRRGLTREAIAALNAALLTKFSTLDFKNIHTLHIFLPIVEKNEPDTFLLINWLRIHQPQIHILVPRADFSTALMTHHTFKGEEDLQKSIFNILEPMQEEQYTGKIDMVIVPLLAFDDRGYRVGYGKGFYDRFLEGQNCIKAGLSFFSSVGTIADTHVNDIRLDLCITPERIVYFSTQASSSSRIGQ